MGQWVFYLLFMVLRDITEVLLWLFHKLRLCCEIAGEFPMYVGDKLAHQTNLITIYVTYHPQKLFHEISILLQIKHSPAFSLYSLDFVHAYLLQPGGNTYCTVGHGAETTAVRIVRVNSIKLCGPQSNNDSTHFI